MTSSASPSHRRHHPAGRRNHTIWNRLSKWNIQKTWNGMLTPEMAFTCSQVTPWDKFALNVSRLSVAPREKKRPIRARRFAYGVLPPPISWWKYFHAGYGCLACGVSPISPGVLCSFRPLRPHGERPPRGEESPGCFFARFPPIAHQRIMLAD